MYDEPPISRREILAILFRHRYGMSAILMTCIAVAVFAVYYLISPSYEAEAVIIINSSYLTEPLRDGPPESEFEKLAGFHTQRDILSSARMAAEAVRRTKLAERRVIGRIERIRMFVGDIKRFIGKQLDIRKWQKPWDPESAAIAAVHDGIQTFALPDSKALRVTLRSKDPKESADVLNALIDAHTDYYYSVIRQKANGVVAFLEKEFQRSQKALDDAERALFEFKRNDRVAVDVARNKPRKQKDSTDIVGFTDSSKIQEELKLYVLKLQEELRVAAQNPDNETRARVTADIETRIRDHLASLSNIPERELELVRLKRQFDIAQDNYQITQRNLTKASLVASGETDKIKLVEVFERAAEPDDLIFPQKKTVLLLAVGLGLVMALTWAFVMDYLDHTIRGARDVQRYLDCRLIASLPEMAWDKQRSAKGAAK